MASPEPTQLIIKNSSVSFVLMGPGGEHRRVIARSDHENLDLVGLDNPTLSELSLQNASPGIPFFASGLQTLVVHTLADTRISDPFDFSDNRTSHLTFAWKGSARRIDRIKIQTAFNAMAPDIMRAISKNSTEALEWQLAGLILLCTSMTKRHTERLKALTIVVSAGGALYLLALLYYLLKGYS